MDSSLQSNTLKLTQALQYHTRQSAIKDWTELENLIANWSKYHPAGESNVRIMACAPDKLRLYAPDAGQPVGDLVKGLSKLRDAFLDSRADYLFRERLDEMLGMVRSDEEPGLLPPVRRIAMATLSAMLPAGEERMQLLIDLGYDQDEEHFDGGKAELSALKDGDLYRTSDDIDEVAAYADTIRYVLANS